MARPRVESLLYFPHDCDAHCETEKIEPLMSIHGLAGHAHYFILLEMIFSTQDGALDISQPEKRKLIARKMFCSEKRFEKILEDELRFGLFDRQLYQDKGILSSEGIRRRRDKILHERTRKRRDYPGVIPGETPEEYSHNDGERGGKEKGKEKEKGKREESPGKTHARNRIEKISFEKAETAWKQFQDAVLKIPSGEKIVIANDYARQIFFDLGRKEKIMELRGQNGDQLHQEFVARYVVLESTGYKKSMVSSPR